MKKKYIIGSIISFIVVIGIIILLVELNNNKNNSNKCPKTNNNYKIVYDDEEYPDIETCIDCTPVKIKNGISTNYSTSSSYRFVYYVYTNDEDKIIRVNVDDLSNTIKPTPIKDENGCITGYKDIHLTSYRTHDGTTPTKR